jgi:uncharacterized protein YdaU (DUF1376 family)
MEPLVGKEVDLTGLHGFVFRVDSYLSSELRAISSLEEIGAALNLWAHAWKQHPPGSLPDDDAVLASFSGAGRRWQKVRKNALRSFVLCSDGRLYHPTLCEEVKKIWEGRCKLRNRIKKFREDVKNNNVKNQQDEEMCNAYISVTKRVRNAHVQTEVEVEGEVEGEVEAMDTSVSKKTTQKKPADAVVCDPSGYSADFENFWKAYPKRAGSNLKLAAWKAWNARLKAGVAAEEMIEGTDRYAAYCRSQGMVGGPYVKMASTFLGPDLHFLEDWIPIPVVGRNGTPILPHPDRTEFQTTKKTGDPI